MTQEFNLTFDIMTIKELAKVIKKPVSTIYEWRREGKIPEECFKVIGKSIFVRIPQIRAFFCS